MKFLGSNNVNTKRFCAIALGIGPLLPVLSTLFIPDFITAYVFKVPLFSRPKVYSCKMKKSMSKLSRGLMAKVCNSQGFSILGIVVSL
jgi:hypothetical protein